MISYTNYQGQVAQIAKRIAAYQLIPAGERNLAALKGEYGCFMQLMLAEIYDAPKGYAWHNDPALHHLGELRSRLSALINEASNAHR